MVSRVEDFLQCPYSPLSQLAHCECGHSRQLENIWNGCYSSVVTSVIRSHLVDAFDLAMVQLFVHQCTATVDLEFRVDITKNTVFSKQWEGGAVSGSVPIDSGCMIM